MPHGTRKRFVTSMLWLSVSSALIGIAGLIGNLLDLEWLAAIVPHRPRMQLVTALCILAAALAIALQLGKGARGLRYAVLQATGAVIALLGVAIGAEYGLDVDLGIDWHLQSTNPLGRFPGRPSPFAAIGLVALGLGMILDGVKSRAGGALREALALWAALIGFVALVGHAFGASAVHLLAGSYAVGVSLPSGVALIMLGLAGWLAHPEHVLLRIAASSGPGGVLVRRLGLLAIIGMPALAALLLVFVRSTGVVDLPLSLAIHSVLSVISALVLLLMTAVRLERSHEAELASRTRAEALFEHAPEGIFIADLSGRYIDVNTAGCRLLRFSRAELLGQTIEDLIARSDVERLWREREVMLQGSVQVAAWNMRRGDGSYAPIEVTAKILADGRWMAFTRDLTDRLELERKLLESRDFLQRVLESSTEYGIVAEDLEGRVVLWNEGARRSYGYELDEITGKPAELLLAPEQRDVWNALHARGLQEGKAEGSLLARRKDGSRFVASVVCTRRLGTDAQTAGVLIVTRDLTLEQRHLAEQAFLSRVGIELAACLEYRETLTRVTELATAFLGDLVAIDVVKDGTLQRARAVEEGEGQAIARAVTELGPVMRPGHPLLTVLETRQPLLLEHITDEDRKRFATSEEHARVLASVGARSAMLVPLIARGQLLAVLSITTRKGERSYGPDDLRLAVELARRAALTLDNVELFQQSRLQGAVTTNLAEGAVLIRASDSRIAYVNPRFEAMFGYPHGELLGLPMEVLVPHESHEPSRSTRELAAQLERTHAWHGEIECVRKDGSRFWASMSLSNFDHDEYGRVWIGVSSDITERKRLEQRTTQALSEKDVLLKEIHHRVKNNLQVISSLFSLQRERTQNEELKALLDESRTRVESIALVHEQLYRSADLVAIDLDEYLRRLVESIRSSFGAANIIIDVDARDVVLDIEQAVPCALLVCELVSNAFKHAFGSAVGRVWVRASRDAQGYCVLDVGDDGHGMPADLDWTKTPSLGLRIVRGLMHQLRASSVLDCSAGTRYTIRFGPWKASVPAAPLDMVRHA